MDPVKMAGIVPPKLQGKGDYAGDLRKVPCTHEHEEHIAADQIFPIIRTEVYYTPTIKHHCPRTALASSLRACSNKVSFDPKIFKGYAAWFRRSLIPKFLQCMDEEIWTVDLEKWLLKYPEAYRAKIRKAIDPNSYVYNGEICMTYEAFTKVEMQFTTVAHEDKDSIWNDVKERQICGPSDFKKAFGNPFINLLEEVATKYFKFYCGRQNWLQICDELQKGERERSDSIWGASDGSGFDMTQYPEMNMLMNELLEACARHENVTWIEPLSIDRFLECIKMSLKLKVSVDHGNLKYEAVGRASGDGWTTFGNTMLMLSYWMYTFELAEIKNYYLKVKGDDVLFNLCKRDMPSFMKAKAQVFTERKDQHVHGLGQICKKIDFGELTELDFLSNEFFLTEEGNYRMVRIPARVIQTNSWSTKLPPGRRREEYRKQLCYSKGMCLKAWADGLPIFSELANKMISLGIEGKLTDYNEYADGARVWHQGRDDREAYLAYLNIRYGVSRHEVLVVEDRIRKIRTLDGVLDVPELEKFYHRI